MSTISFQQPSMVMSTPLKSIKKASTTNTIVSPKLVTITDNIIINYVIVKIIYMPNLIYLHGLKYVN